MQVGCVDGVSWEPAYSVGRVWRLTVYVRLQTEPEDRFSGRRRSPQQPEFLAAAGGNFRLILWIKSLLTGPF